MIQSSHFLYFNHSFGLKSITSIYYFNTSFLKRKNHKNITKLKIRKFLYLRLLNHKYDRNTKNIRFFS